MRCRLVLLYVLLLVRNMTLVNRSHKSVPPPMMPAMEWHYPQQARSRAALLKKESLMKPLNPKLVALFFALALISGQLIAAEDGIRYNHDSSLASLFSQLRLFGSSQSVVEQSTASGPTIYCSEQGDPFNTCYGCNQSGCTCDSSGWWSSVCCCDSSVKAFLRP